MYSVKGHTVFKTRRKAGHYQCHCYVENDPPPKQYLVRGPFLLTSEVERRADKRITATAGIQVWLFFLQSAAMCI